MITNLADLLPARRNDPARQESVQPTSMGKVTIVGLMNRDDDDGRLLSEVAGRSGWQVVFAKTYGEVGGALDQGNVPVVFCDRDLLGMGWRKAVERLSAPPHCACVILISEAIDANLWNEVVRGGGYEVLAKPLRAEGVIRAVRLAWSYWTSPARTGLLFDRSPRLAKEGRS
jgi:DNA-binding NtrC family response regulator